MLKPTPPLKTCPVGAPLPPSPPGMETTRDWGVPVLSYSVATPLALSETQNGVAGPSEIPHGFTRFGSVCAAGMEPSETRLVCVKVTCPPERSRRDSSDSTRTLD